VPPAALDGRMPFETGQSEAVTPLRS